MSEVVIFKVDCMLHPMQMETLRRSLRDQIRDGAVVVPPFISVEYASKVISENCEFKLMDRDGNVVEVNA